MLSLRQLCLKFLQSNSSVVCFVLNTICLDCCCTHNGTFCMKLQSDIDVQTRIKPCKVKRCFVVVSCSNSHYLMLCYFNPVVLYQSRTYFKQMTSHEVTSGNPHCSSREFRLVSLKLQNKHTSNTSISIWFYCVRSPNEQFIHCNVFAMKLVRFSFDIQFNE